jgi:DNA invertase Pin-like site-specific DNA recombinase
MAIVVRFGRLSKLQAPPRCGASSFQAARQATGTGSQSLEAQLEQLKAAGCEKVYAEKRSGADGERKELARLLKAARPDDTVVVCRLDRLARSTRDLLNVLDRFGKNGIGFKSLRETAVDTTTAQGRLVVSILAAISEFEREIILSRISEGRNVPARTAFASVASRS